MDQINGPRSTGNEQRKKEAKTRKYVVSSIVCALHLCSYYVALSPVYTAESLGTQKLTLDNLGPEQRSAICKLSGFIKSLELIRMSFSYL